MDTTVKSICGSTIKGGTDPERSLEAPSQFRPANWSEQVDLFRRLRKFVAVYLMVSAVYAVAGIGTGGMGMPATAVPMVLMAVFVGATLAGGAGLFLGKNWGYWTALTVLTLQLVKIRFDGFTYDVLGLVGIYLYAGGKFSIGISAAFDPRFTISTGTSTSWWLGVNIFAAVLIGYLLFARGRSTSDLG